MKPERFEAIIAAFGAAAARWPKAEREAAQNEAGAHAGALRAEAALDRALDLDQARVDLDRFAARVLAAMPSSASASASASARRPLSLRALSRAPNPVWALAACAMLGVMVGWGAGALAPSDGADSSIAAVFGLSADVIAGGAEG